MYGGTEMKAIDYIINYMYQDEKKSYEELLADLGVEGDPEELARTRNDNHVFCALVRVIDDQGADFAPDDGSTVRALNNYAADKSSYSIEFKRQDGDVYEAQVPCPLPGLVGRFRLRAVVHRGVADLQLLVNSAKVPLASFALEDYL